MQPRRLIAAFGAVALTFIGGAAVAYEAGEASDAARIEATEHTDGSAPAEEPETTTLTVEPETTTDRSDNGARAFSEWVRSTDLTGCQRGQTVTRYARQGPTSFEAGQTVEPVPVDQSPGACADAGDSARDAGEGAATLKDGSDDEEVETLRDDTDGAATEEAEEADRSGPRNAGHGGTDQSEHAREPAAEEQRRGARPEGDDRGRSGEAPGHERDDA